MILDLSILKELHNLAIKAATKAGLYIANSRPKAIEYKTAGSSDASQIVTEVDRESQRIIIEMLNDSITKYDLGLLAEEDEDDGSRLIKDYFWCIDPLDGTLPFVDGLSGYSVAISLIKQDGTPVIGVAYDPLEKNCYSAYKGGGAYKNGQKWHPQRKNDHFSLFHHKSLLKHPDCESILSDAESKFSTYPKIEKSFHAGAVMNAIWALEQQPSYYFALPKENEGGGCIWDFAATACIYNELGFSVMSYFDKPLFLNDPQSIFLNKQGVKYSAY